MAFSPDQHFLYLTDTRAGRILRFEYYREDGRLGQGQTLIEYKEGEGQPDGLTVDKQGNLWSARWDGASIGCYDPNGRLLEVISMPAKNVTSMTFAGNDLYVTTAGGRHRPQAGIQAGALLRIKTEASSPPEFRSRISF